MAKTITIEDVIKDKVNITEIRFRIIVLMLQNDENLAKRIKAYVQWYH